MVSDARRRRGTPRVTTDARSRGHGEIKSIDVLFKRARSHFFADGGVLNRPGLEIFRFALPPAASLAGGGVSCGAPMLGFVLRPTCL